MTISTNCRQYHLGVLLIINRLTIHQLHSGGFFFASTSFLKASIFFAMFGTFGMETKKKKQAVRQTFEQKGGGHHLQVVSWMYCQISFFPPKTWMTYPRQNREKLSQSILIPEDLGTLIVMETQNWKRLCEIDSSSRHFELFRQSEVSGKIDKMLVCIDVKNNNNVCTRQYGEVFLK